MNSIYKDLIYLLSCSVNDLVPDSERVKDMDLEKLHDIAKFHTVTAAVCIALERAGIKNDQFYEDKKKAIRKNIYLDTERQIIFNKFECQKIWYMPLKGAVLKEIYPENGMRQMADNDVLYDKNKQKLVKAIMLESGYTAESVGKSHHDVYLKLPVLNFELHTELFNSNHTESLFKYYKNIKDRLIKDEDSQYGYHMSDDDFYVYITAHEWKHFNNYGTGLRSLLDCYMYINQKHDILNMEYIIRQCKQLGISDFESKRRSLKVFSSYEYPELNDKEAEMLMFYLTAGTYGTLQNGIKKQLKDQSKFSFWIHSIFIPHKQMIHSVPFTSKSKLLYPIGVVWRCIRVLFFRMDLLKQTIKTVMMYNKN